MNKSISNSDDVIDSRDVIERIEELESDRQLFTPDYAGTETEPANSEQTWAQANEDDAAELTALLALQSDAEGYADDWHHGVALIRDSYFEDYARELVQDIGDLPHDIPGYLVIDWEATARNIQQDYTAVEFERDVLGSLKEHIMSKQSERDNFIAEATKAGLTVHTARKLLRYAATLQRLSEAQCNGDWPADNGERKVVRCSRCESLWARSSMLRVKSHLNRVDNHVPLICKDCRTQELVNRVLEGSTLMAEFQGDPRGYVLRLFPKDSKPEDRESGRERGIGVPA